MNKHTPGPWFVGPYTIDHHGNGVTSKEVFVPGQWISHVRGDDDSIMEANAKIIAAAPEMIELLQELVNGNGILDSDKRSKINTLITKATK